MPLHALSLHGPGSVEGESPVVKAAIQSLREAGGFLSLALGCSPYVDRIWGMWGSYFDIPNIYIYVY